MIAAYLASPPCYRSVVRCPSDELVAPVVAIVMDEVEPLHEVRSRTLVRALAAGLTPVTYEGRFSLGRGRRRLDAEWFADEVHGVRYPVAPELLALLVGPGVSQVALSDGALSDGVPRLFGLSSGGLVVSAVVPVDVGRTTGRAEGSPSAPGKPKATDWKRGQGPESRRIRAPKPERRVSR